MWFITSSRCLFKVGDTTSSLNPSQNLTQLLSVGFYARGYKHNCPPELTCHTKRGPRTRTDRRLLVEVVLSVHLVRRWRVLVVHQWIVYVVQQPVTLHVLHAEYNEENITNVCFQSVVFS